MLHCYATMPLYQYTFCAGCHWPCHQQHREAIHFGQLPYTVHWTPCAPCAVMYPHPIAIGPDIAMCHLRRVSYARFIIKYNIMMQLAWALGPPLP